MYELHEIHFEITNVCPHKCLHCSTGMIESQNLKSLTLEESKSIIKQISETPGRPKVVHLTGGEPLSHENIDDIIYELKIHDIIPSMFTTGFLSILDKDKNKQNFPIQNEHLIHLWRRGLKETVFSIHSVNPKIQDEIMQTEDCLRRQLDIIKYIVQNTDIKVKVNCVPMSLNQNYIEDVVRNMKEIGVKEVRFLRFVPQGNAINNPKLFVDKTTTVDVIKRIKKLAANYSDNNFSVISEGYPHFMKCRPFDFMNSGCQAGKSLAHINLNKDVFGCPAFKQKPEYFAGNLKDDTLLNIWDNSSVFQKLRSVNKDNIEEPCSSCSMFSFCEGGCSAQRSWSKETIFSAPDPICFLEIGLPEEEK